MARSRPYHPVESMAIVSFPFEPKERRAYCGIRLVRPHRQGGFKEGIGYLNQRLFSEGRVAELDHIDDQTVLGKLLCPGACIQVLGQGTYQGEGIQRDDEPSSMFLKKRV